MKEVIIALILQGFDQQNTFTERWSWFKFNNLRLTLGMALQTYSSVAKWLKLKVKRFEG